MSAETGTVGPHIQNLECAKQFVHIEDELREHYRWQERQNGSLTKMAAAQEEMKIELMRHGEILKQQDAKLDEVLTEVKANRAAREAPQSAQSSEKDRLKWFLWGLAFASGGGAIKLLELLGK